jgi:chromosome segregation ATPase
MPIKGSTRGRSAEQMQRLAEARAKHHPTISECVDTPSPTESSNLHNCHSFYQEKLKQIEEKCIILESSLLAEQETTKLCKERLKPVEERCTVLESRLLAEQRRSTNLYQALKKEKRHSDKLYQKLRVERRARQRGNNCKMILGQQIQMLQEAGMTSDAKMKESTAKAIKALTKVEKENSSLRSDLSKALDRCALQTAKSHQKFLHIGKQIKGYQRELTNLKKRCKRAAAKKVTAKKSQSHKLLHKGIYTEETRNLIRLLVKAGCSRGYVGQVIHAVLKTAGISVHGKISRRTVSRVVLEGYYAAQMQLGHEIKATKRKYFFSTNNN